jgi:hypothetical protein
MASAPDPFADTAPASVRGGSLVEIAARLWDIAGELQHAAATGDTARPLRRSDSGGIGSGGIGGETRWSLLALARHTYALRRQRAELFGSADLFGEPAWDILLDLYIARGEGKPVSVSSACIGSASPPTTGLRWLSVLTEQGLIAREADAQDHRRIMVHLTERGIAAMERFLTLARGRPA